VVREFGSVVSLVVMATAGFAAIGNGTSVMPRSSPVRSWTRTGNPGQHAVSMEQDAARPEAAVHGSAPPPALLVYVARAYAST